MATHVHNNPEIQLSIDSAMRHLGVRIYDVLDFLQLVSNFHRGQSPAAEQQLSELAHHPSPCWFPRKLNISYVLNLNRECVISHYTSRQLLIQKKNPPRTESDQMYLRARPSKQIADQQDEASMMVECAGIVRGESRRVKCLKIVYLFLFSGLLTAFFLKTFRD